MKKKLLSVLLVGVMTLSLFACGKSDSTSETSNKATEDSKDSSKDTTKDAAKDTAAEIIDYSWFCEYTGSDVWTQDEGTFSKYIGDTMGISFAIDNPAEDAATTLGLMLATGELPDLITVSDGTIRQELIASGEVWDLQELYDTYLPDSWILANFPEDCKKELIIRDGGWYCFPSHMETTDNRKNYPPDSEFWADLVNYGNNDTIAYNADIMNELGITADMLTTEAGLYEVLETVAKSGYTSPDGEPVIPVLFNGSGYQGSILSGILSWTFGSTPVDAAGNYRNIYLSDGFKKGMKFVNKVSTEGWLDTNTLTLDETAIKAYLASGRAFMYIGNQTLISLERVTNYKAVGPIFAEDGSTPVYPRVETAGTGWLQTLISKKAKNPEKLAEFISYMASPEGLFRHFYGVEGEDYTKDDTGAVTLTESGQDKRTNYKTSTYNNFWGFANTSFERHTEQPPAENEIRWVENQLMTTYAKNEKVYIYNRSLITFPEGTIEASSDLGISETQITNYMESEVAALMIADDFEAEYNSMIETLNGYGIDQIDAVYNEVYKKNCELYDDSIEDVNAK